MNISQMKEIEDLKEQAAIQGSKASALFNSNVTPLLKKYEQDLVKSIEKHFESSGFEIKKNYQNQNLSAQYKELIFKVTVNSNSIMITNGSKLIGHVYITYKSFKGATSYLLPNDEFLAEKTKIEKDQIRSEKNIEYYTNPEVYYEESGKKLNSPEEVLKGLKDFF